MKNVCCCVFVQKPNELCLGSVEVGHSSMQQMLANPCRCLIGYKIFMNDKATLTCLVSKRCAYLFKDSCWSKHFCSIFKCKQFRWMYSNERSVFADTVFVTQCFISPNTSWIQLWVFTVHLLCIHWTRRGRKYNVGGSAQMEQEQPELMNRQWRKRSLKGQQAKICFTTSFAVWFCL